MAREMGQPSLAVSAAAANSSALTPSTFPATVSSLETTVGAPSTMSNVTLALTSSVVGGVPARVSPADSAML